MSDGIRQLVEEYHPYYEVLPYYVVIEEGHGSASSSTRRIQAGSDIDIYGRAKNHEVGPPPDYELACATLRKIAEMVAHDPSDSLAIEVIPSPESLVLDVRNGLQPLGMIRIRVRHCGALEQPAGPAEGRALAEVERQLQGLGIRSG